MARVVNEAANAAKRTAILDAAQRAIATKGYEQMAIADLLSELQMSSGAFYHYFDSKPALLSALVERIGSQIEPLVLPIVHDPALGAIEKLQSFFAKLDQFKIAHKSFMVAYWHVWYGDENAIVRHKLYMARVKRITPWLAAIIRQGAEEGVFTTSYPEQMARASMALLEDLGYATAELLFAEERLPDTLSRLERIVIATADALERLLGAPAECLQRAAREGLSEWVVPFSLNQEE